MSLWDPHQREWLQAMGLAPLSLAGEGDSDADAAEAGSADARAVDAEPAPAVLETRAAPVPPEFAAPREPAPVPAEPDVAPAAPIDTAARLAALESARAGGARGEGPLWDALLRATRQSPALAARSLREFGVDPVALREDPAAKRALWPRLRRLRTGRRG